MGPPHTMVTSRTRRLSLRPMEKRRLGKTDMDVSVLGFGGAEICYEGATAATVEELLNSALDAGLTLIDTAISGIVDLQKRR